MRQLKNSNSWMRPPHVVRSRGKHKKRDATQEVLVFAPTIIQRIRQEPEPLVIEASEFELLPDAQDEIGGQAIG